MVKLLVVALGLVIALQLVPYGRDHANPPVTSQPKWDSDATRALFFRSCRDCHSNETIWPWYSHVAPASWLMQYDVEEGRSHFNVSEWDRPKQDGDEAAEMVREREMPPWFYTPMHSDAMLSAEELKQLIAGLEATFGSEDEGDAREGHAH